MAPNIRLESTILSNCFIGLCVILIWLERNWVVKLLWDDTVDIDTDRSIYLHSEVYKYIIHWRDRRLGRTCTEMTLTRMHDCHNVLSSWEDFLANNNGPALWPRFQYKGRIYPYMYFHYKDKKVVRPSYLYNGNLYTGKTAFSYWDAPCLKHSLFNGCSGSR